MTRWLGLAGIAGGAVWIASWLGNSQTAEGNEKYLGLVEGDWRALLNVALVGFLLAVWGVRRRYGAELRGAGELGIAGAFAGLGAALIGNVLEFGLTGGELWIDQGWTLVVLGGLVAVASLVVLGVTGARRLEGAPQWLLALAAGSFSAIPLAGITIGLGFVLLGAALVLPEREAIALGEAA